MKCLGRDRRSRWFLMFKIAFVALVLSATMSVSALGQTTSGSGSKPTSGRSGTRTPKSTPPKRGTSTPAKPADPAPDPPPAKDPTPPPADPQPPATATHPSAAGAASVPAAGSTALPSFLLIGGLIAIGGAQWLMLRQLGRDLRDGLAETKLAAAGAAASAAHAARALAASERAYLVARSWSMRPPTSGEVPEVEFIVENVGRTPARKTLVRGQIEVREAALPPTPKWRAVETAGGTLTIPPGGRPASTLAGDRPLTREESERLRAGTSFLSIWGRVDYEDVLGSAQAVCFAWRYDMATGALTYDTASDAYHEIS